MLNLGDIVITHNDKQVIVIERKTTNDLDCSIKDGRYREQKYRLLNLQKENVQVLYLIDVFVDYTIIQVINLNIESIVICIL